MQNAPAPWSLRGDGYMIFYKFSREFVAQQGFVPPALEDSFDGFLGSVMLVNYHTSPIGSYRELLFMPGKFKTESGKYDSITKIYVNTEVSTYNGRANWGIPKETVDFRRNLVSKNFWGGDTECIELLDATGEPFFSITLSSGGIPFPVTTAMLPIRLIQHLQDTTFLTTPSGSGIGRLAHIKHLSVNPAYFPDIAQATPLMAVKVSDFKMEFPAASLVPQRSV